MVAKVVSPARISVVKFASAISCSYIVRKLLVRLVSPRLTEYLGRWLSGTTYVSGSFEAENTTECRFVHIVVDRADRVIQLIELSPNETAAGFSLLLRLDLQRLKLNFADVDPITELISTEMVHAVPSKRER